MLAKELRQGDQYYDADGKLQITVLTNALPEGINHKSGKPQIYVGVAHADGGHSPRYFDADEEVPYVRPYTDAWLALQTTI
jgi:hypothetical protein